MHALDLRASCMKRRHVYGNFFAVKHTKYFRYETLEAGSASLRKLHVITAREALAMGMASERRLQLYDALLFGHYTCSTFFPDISFAQNAVLW